jgi:hypothetical protein
MINETVQVVTSFAPKAAMQIQFRTGGSFELQGDESIELYRSRKYTDSAQGKLVTGYHELDRAESLYSSRSAFGVATLLLERDT